MSETQASRESRTLRQRLDDLEDQVWKVRWGLYVLAAVTASPKFGGPNVSDAVAVVLGL
jgi:hypothetical protein